MGTDLGRDNLDNYAVASKIIRDRSYYDSVLASEIIKSRNSHTVKLVHNEDLIKYADVQYYLVEMEAMKVDAVFHELRFKEYLSPEYCKYIFSVEDIEEKIVCDVTIIECVLVRIDEHDTTYV